MKRHMEWYSVTLIEICMTFYDLSDIPEVNSHMSQKVNLWLSMTLVQFLMTFDDFSVSSSENFKKLYLPTYGCQTWNCNMNQINKLNATYMGYI